MVIRHRWISDTHFQISSLLHQFIPAAVIAIYCLCVSRYYTSQFTVTYVNLLFYKRKENYKLKRENVLFTVLSDNSQITEMQNSWRLLFCLLKCLNYIIQYVAVTSFQIPPQPKAITQVIMFCVNAQFYAVEL
jgi:hypothetical protein